MPVLLAPIDADDSMREVKRICADPKHGFALMAVTEDGMLVGSIGLVRVQWWYNTAETFLTDRWFFCVDGVKHSGVAAALKAHVDRIAEAGGTVAIINGKLRKGGRAIYHTLPDVKNHAPSLAPDGRLRN